MSHYSKLMPLHNQESLSFLFPGKHEKMVSKQKEVSGVFYGECVAWFMKS